MKSPPRPDDLRGYNGLAVSEDLLRHNGRAERVEQPLERGYGGVVVREGVVVGSGLTGRLMVREGIVRLI